MKSALGYVAVHTQVHAGQLEKMSFASYFFPLSLSTFFEDDYKNKIVAGKERERVTTFAVLFPTLKLHDFSFVEKVAEKGGRRGKVHTEKEREKDEVGDSIKSPP